MRRRFPVWNRVRMWVGFLVLVGVLGCAPPQAVPQREPLRSARVLTVRFGAGTLEPGGRVGVRAYLGHRFRWRELRSLPADRAWLCTATVGGRRYFVHLMRFRTVRFYLTAGQYRIEGSRMVIPGQLKVSLLRTAFARDTGPFSAQWLDGTGWSEVVVSLVPPQRARLWVPNVRAMDCSVEGLETILQRFHPATGAGPSARRR